MKKINTSRWFMLMFASMARMSGDAYGETLNSNGLGSLSNLMVDASLGEWDSYQAMSVANWFNTVNPNLYGFGFDQRQGDMSLALSDVNQQLEAADDSGWDLNSLVGPNSRYNFTENGMSCANDPERYIGSNVPGDVSSCIGFSPLENSLATVIQVTTISNTFNRPTSQFQRDIRRFSANTMKQGITGGGSAADNYAFDGRFGTYFSGGGSFGSLDGNASQDRVGFNTYNQTGTGAFDYRFTDWAVAGFMFNYTGNQNDLFLNAGRLLTDSYRFMPFASFIPFDNAYIDVMAGYGYQTYDSNRQGAMANYSSDQALASIDIGYTYPIGAFEITGFAGGSYIGTDVAGYTESVSETSVKPYNVSSWTSTLGSQFAYAISTNFGVVQPILRMEWVHAYNDAGTVTIIPQGGLATALPSALGIYDWGNFTAGVQTTLPQGMMAFLNYQGQVMNGGQNNGVLGGLRLEF